MLKQAYRYLCLVVFALAVIVHAQTNTTGLSGLVSDPSGAVIPGATVTIVVAATGFTKTDHTSAKGEYSFLQIPPGTYTITAQAPGFSQSVTTVQLLVATPQSINMKMNLDTQNSIVTVETTSQINIPDATLGAPFNSEQVHALPYLSNNVMSLLSLQAGALSLDPGTSAETQSTTEYRTGAINGARQDQTNVTLDGMDNNDQNNGYAFYGVLRSTRDSVQEFRVVTTNANADAGRSSGAQVSMVTKSGTNTLHGTAYYIYRSPAAASNNWFFKQSLLNSGKPNVAAKVLQHTFGATLGGPIMKDKLFWFGAYEGYKQASNTVVPGTVPSVFNPAAGLPKTSDGFGGLVTGTVSYTTAANATQTLQAADIKNMDYTGRGLDAAAVNYFNLYPRSNSNSSGDGINTGGYQFASPAPFSNITNILRLDYNVSAKHQIFVRGNLQSDNILSTIPFPIPGAVPSSNKYANNKGIATGWNWTPSANVNNNLRYGFIRQGSATRGAVSSGYITISGLTALYPTTTSNIYIEPVHNIVDDFTIVRGRHTIQVGLNERILINNRYADSTLYPNGSISVSLLQNAGVAGKTGNSFDPGTFGFPAVASTFRTSYNNAILAAAGVITSSSQYTNYTLSGNTMNVIPTGQTLPSRRFKSWEQEYYIQDQWKATRNLTLTAGLRYVYLQTPYETNGQQIAPTVSMDTFFQLRAAGASSGTSYNTRTVYAPAGKANHAADFWSPQNLNFAPRFAFAYSPLEKLSIRGGYALAFDHFGQAVVNAFDASGGFKLNASTTNSYGTIDNSPRFTGFGNVPTTPSSAAPLTLPYTPPDNSFNFTSNINRNQKTPYAQTVNLSVQGEIKKNLVVSAAYVGRFGRHIMASWDASQPNNLSNAASGMTYFQAMKQLAILADQKVSPSAVQSMTYWQNVFPNASYPYKDPNTGVITTYTGTQAVYAKLLAEDRGNETDILYYWDDVSAKTAGRAASANGSVNNFFYPQYGSMFALVTMGTSNYNAFQLSVHQTLSRGLQYSLNYTLSKSMDLGSSPERAGTGNNRISNTLNPAGNYGLSDFDARHNITANFMVDSPFGRKGYFFQNTNRLVDSIIGGWQLTGINHYSSGMPWTATSSVYGTNFAASTQLIATQPVNTSGHHTYVPGAGNKYETAFSGSDATTNPAGKFRFVYPGEAGQRNNLKADGYFSMDAGISKAFQITEKHSFKLQAEAFNVFNSVRFNTLGTNFSSGSFGRYSTVLVQPRQMQFSAKYNF